MENEPPSSGLEEGTTHPSLRRYTPPMILCFTNTSLIPALGDSLNDGIAHSPNQRPPPQLPDYPFLSAARYLIEANMKETWGNLINIAQDIGGVVDEDEDGDYSDEGFEPAPKTPPPTPPTLDSIQPTGASPEPDEGDRGLMNHGLFVSIRNARRWVERLIYTFSYLDFVRMGGAAGYRKDGIKERWEASKANGGASCVGRIIKIYCSSNEEDSNEDIRLFHITPRITGYSPPPRPTSSSTPIQDKLADANAQDGIRERWEALKAHQGGLSTWA
ncbi:hypothetical protein F5887DRAFT_1077966 [Amanita rubescens]|nr:hypothetical protein F5887DRAFT_1077966 [Amanita rubescens]